MTDTCTLTMQLLLVRSVVEVEKSAKDLFSLLTSAEGSDIIDDSTVHDPPVEILQWDDRCLAQVLDPTLVLYCLVTDSLHRHENSSSRHASTSI